MDDRTGIRRTIQSWVLAASVAGFALPEIADQPWGREIGLVDPFGNRLRFCERPATG